MEAVTWTALGIHQKREFDFLTMRGTFTYPNLIAVVMLNVCGYYDPLKQLYLGGEST